MKKTNFVPGRITTTIHKIDKKPSKTQLSRGNCMDCKYRTSTTDLYDKTYNTCAFYIQTGKRFRTDAKGNCVENAKKESEEE